jgi:hypothetical protein
MQLDIAKIKGHGWEPKWNSEEAVRLAAEQLIKAPGRSRSGQDVFASRALRQGNVERPHTD